MSCLGSININSARQRLTNQFNANVILHRVSCHFCWDWWVKKSQAHKPKTYQRYFVTVIHVFHSCVVFIPHPNNVTMLWDHLATKTPPSSRWHSIIKENHRDRTSPHRIQFCNDDRTEWKSPFCTQNWVKLWYRQLIANNVDSFSSTRKISIWTQHSDCI